MDNKNNVKDFFKKQLKFFIPYFFILITTITYKFAYTLKFSKRLGGKIYYLKDHKILNSICKMFFQEITEKVIIYNPFDYFTWRIEFAKKLPNMIKSTDTILFFGLLFYLFIILLILKKEKEETVHGAARWASLEEIKKMGLYNEHGVVLGRDSKNQVLRDLSDKHILFAAPTRSGKGINTGHPTSYSWQDSMVVNDIKGELWRDTSGYRKEVLGQKVFMFSPIDTDGVSCSYNPLDAIKIGTAHEFEDVQVITKTLLDTEGKGEADHWITSASNLLNAVILHVLYAKKGASLSDVASFLNPESENLMDVIADIIGVKRENEANEIGLAVRTWVKNGYNDYPDKGTEDWEDWFWTNDKGEKEWLHKGKSCFNHLKHFSNKNLFRDIYNPPFNKLDEDYALHPLVAKEFNSFFRTPEKERGSILSTANSKMKLFLDVIIKKHIGKSDFTIKQLMDEKITIYLVTPPKSLDRTKPLFRLVFTQIIFELTGRMKDDPKGIKTATRSGKFAFIDKFLNWLYAEPKKKFKNQLLLLIDEFPALDKLDVVEKGIPYVAGYGIKCLLITQSLKQLKQKYGRDNSIVDNCSIQLYLTPNENESAKEISDMFGSYTKKVWSVSKKGMFELIPTRSSSYVGRQLMRPEEVRTLPYDKILILHTGQNPILGNKMFYFQDKQYKDLKKLYPAPLKSDLGKVETVEKTSLQEYEKDLEDSFEIKEFKL